MNLKFSNRLSGSNISLFDLPSLNVFAFLLGLDHGTMGKELLHKLNRWCSQWEFLGCYVQRLVN